MTQKTKRLVSLEGGLMIKPTGIDIEGVGGNGTIVPQSEEKEFVETLTKRTGFRFFQGDIKQKSKGSSDTEILDNTGGIRVPVDNETNNWCMNYVTPDSIFQAYYGTNSDGMDMVSQTSGVCHAIRSFNNNQNKSGNNGYTWGCTTGDRGDKWKGASPMPVVGLTFRVWTIRGGDFYWYNGKEMTSDYEFPSDNFINRMWLLYLKPDGSIYNKPVLPEKTNSGTKFMNKDNLSDKYDDKPEYKQYQFKDCRSMYSAKKIRVWHGDEIALGDCFIGFYINWGIGRAKNADVWHNLTFGGFAPILRQDLYYLQPNDADVEPSHTTPYMKPLTKRDDLYKIYPELNPDGDSDLKRRKLWTVGDSALTNDFDTNKNNWKSKQSYYQRSFSLKAGNMDRWQD